MTLKDIFARYSISSPGFCVAVESHCGFDISRDEIGAIAEQVAAQFPDVARAAPSDLAAAFESIWRG